MTTQLTALAYNMRGVSVLGYLSQLVPPPEVALEKERGYIHRLGDG